MAVYRFQVRLQGSSGLPEDIYENVLFYDVNSPDTVQGRCEDLRDHYIGANNVLAGVSAVEVRAYPLAGGQPVASAGPTTRTPISLSLPTEVALCLSYATTDDPDKATSGRYRGRIYLGPLNTTGGLRPSSGIIGYALAFGQALAAIGTAGNTTWVMYSRADNATRKIESIWVDNAWDTQRRRGAAPTARTVQDVQ